MLKDLVRKNRSYRRFYQSEKIEMETLKELVDLGRLSASGRNMQPLKYVLVNDPKKNAEVFTTVAWAGYLKDWDGPEEGERPSAYIVVLLDKDLSPTAGVDHGIASQSILLGAAEKGYGGCMIATIKKNELSSILKLGPQFEIVMVLALGKPKENVILEPVSASGDIKYYRDSEGGHHVPKRALEDIIINSD